jgi:hypothetical protein
VQRADKVLKAREELQERIKSIRNLVSSTTKSANERSSPAAVEPRLAKHYSSPSRRSLSPQQSPQQRHTSIPPEPPQPANMSHVDDRPISLPSEYIKARAVVSAAPSRLQGPQEHATADATPRTPTTLDATPHTPTTGIDRYDPFPIVVPRYGELTRLTCDSRCDWNSLDHALSAIENMSINNFDSLGMVAPEKSEIEVEVVGTEGFKEKLWRIKQQKEALKARFFLASFPSLDLVDVLAGPSSRRS